MLSEEKCIVSLVENEIELQQINETHYVFQRLMWLKCIWKVFENK